MFPADLSIRDQRSWANHSKALNEKTTHHSTKRVCPDIQATGYTADDHYDAYIAIDTDTTGSKL